MKVTIQTLGCKVNQYESKAIFDSFEKHGYTLSDNEKDADIIIINSCSVTAESDKKSRKTVRHAKKINPNAVVVLTGCYPEGKYDETLSLKEADIISGNRDKTKLVDKVQKFIADKNRICEFNKIDNNAEFEKISISNYDSKIRAVIKIEDGCNSFCSYCIIPYLRGRVRSKPLADVVSEAYSLTENGYPELILSGIHLDCYGTDLKEYNITDLLFELNKLPKLKRIRLGSIDPSFINENTVEKFIKIKKLAPQFHLSLQSGCDKTLTAMNRKYTKEQFRNSVFLLRKAFPACMITTDVITGFPNETENDFSESLEFIKEIRFLKVHVFPYSLREGTKAATMTNQIDISIRNNRAIIMQKEADSIRYEILKSFIGKTVEIIIEKIQNCDCEGYTDNYVLIKIKANNLFIGQIINVKIIDAKKDFCFGEIFK